MPIVSVPDPGTHPYNLEPILGGQTAQCPSGLGEPHGPRVARHVYWLGLAYSPPQASNGQYRMIHPSQLRLKSVSERAPLIDDLQMHSHGTPAYGCACQSPDSGSSQAHCPARVLTDPVLGYDPPNLHEETLGRPRHAYCTKLRGVVGGRYQKCVYSGFDHDSIIAGPTATKSFYFPI